jgi:uncharacterized FAD-dependent dehydrogenase
MAASPTRWIEKFLLRKCRTDGWERPNTLKLYPVSEGAGFARVILSAGVDGIRVAEAVACAMLDTRTAPGRDGRG